ncbi:MAG TPA: diacylglycerol kinase family protein [Saprospiraceae bacterium]|nr:diacylglycerol kinase family protein [Saprospiraceae bacterium]HPN70451.1 diacylglycerol kinase family protein [Saprospiraceae bacterium]
MQEKEFSLRNRLHSFRFAFNGLKVLFQEEHNSRIHLVIAIVAIVAGFLCKITSYEWLAILLSLGLVISLEIVNTALEKIADFISPQYDSRIKIIKDLAAAGVLVGAFAAVGVGLVVFGPRILEILAV